MGVVELSFLYDRHCLPLEPPSNGWPREMIVGMKRSGMPLHFCIKIKVEGEPLRFMLHRTRLMIVKELGTYFRPQAGGLAILSP